MLLLDVLLIARYVQIQRPARSVLLDFFWILEHVYLVAMVAILAGHKQTAQHVQLGTIWIPMKTYVILVVQVD